MATYENLLLLFERPSEPIFIPKGVRNVVFQVPPNFIEDRYQAFGNDLQNQYAQSATDIIPVQNIQVPDLTPFMRLSMTENFSLLIQCHRELATMLIKIFMGAKDMNELLSLAAYTRERVNPQLFHFSLSVAILHRADTKKMNLPHFAEIFPNKFVNAESLTGCINENFLIPSELRQPLEVRRPVVDEKYPESRLWYFREDLGANLHHWHWHLVYPTTIMDMVTREIIDKDRRGELFYYMHQQILARYNFERFANDLKRVEPFSDYRGPIEPYYPNLDAWTTSKRYVARPRVITLEDMDRIVDCNRLAITVSSLENFRDQIINGISQGFIVGSNGERVVLDEVRGIDILGNVIEASDLSPNKEFYGDLHSNLHVIISYQHDPKGFHGESVGVVGDLATALRDPVFYRIHAHVDELFNMHKEKLSPYTEQQLTYHGICVNEFEVQTNDGKINQFHTFFQQSDVNMSKGLDFQSDKGSVFTRFTHLQHNPFTYNILVTNNSSHPCHGMVRIYIAPKFDEWGKNMWFNVQRRFFVELDKFVVVLKPGQNIIKRESMHSTVTIPYERTFRNLDGAGNAAFDFCGCGWPHHLLIPRGTVQGQHAELFVMVSNYDEDRVDEDYTDRQADCRECIDAASYCGIRDKKYPDSKAMGYPFDRIGREDANILHQFLTPNMRVTDVKIFHTDRTEVNRQVIARQQCP